MLKVRYSTAFIVSLLISAVLFIITFYNFIIHPNHLLLQMDGDAVKNYFTFLFHSVNGKGAWFTGMNYPYGENIVFTDGQPFLSVPLSYIRSILPVSYEGALTVLHLFLVFCYVLAIVYLFKILRHFGVNSSVAVIFSTLIVLLSPQLLKINGHFALSYSCVIPMMWYWFIQYLNSNKIKYPVFIAILISIAVFSHPYFLAMYLFWLAFYSLGYLILIRDRLSSKVKHLFPLALSFITVFAVFKLFLFLTDPIKDRPTYPWGFLDACTIFNQIYSSVYSPIWQMFKDEPFYQNLNKGGEGNVYLGFVTLFAVITALGIAFKNLILKQEDAIISKNRFSFIWFFVAFGTLAVAFGFPFILNSDILMYASLLKQFRSLGRFSWMFYYIMSVYGVLAIHHFTLWLTSKDKKTLAHSVLGLAVILWGYEASGYFGYIAKKTNEGLNNYDTFFSKKEKGWQQLLLEKGYKADDFQGIVLLPYFHVGTEKIWLNKSGTDWLLVHGFKAAIQLKLPVVDVMMSRSSWGQAMDQAHLIGGPYTKKPIFEIGGSKPYLVLYSPEKSYLDVDSKYLFESSDFIGEGFNFNIYAWYPKRMEKSDSIKQKRGLEICNTMAFGDTCLNCEQQYLVEHFELGNNKYRLFGTGALKAKRDYDSVIFVKNFNEKTIKLVEYEFSVWVLVNWVDYSSPNFELTFTDENGKELKKYIVHTSGSLDNDNMWYRASEYVIVPKGVSKFTCKVYDWGYYWLDELLLRPTTSTIISKSPSGDAMINNHILKN